MEITGPEALVARAPRPAADDLRRAGKITGDLVFTVPPTPVRELAGHAPSCAEVAPAG